MTNLRNTSSVSNITADQKVVQMAEGVWDWEPEVAPFLKLLTLSSSGKKGVEGTHFYHLEQQRLAVETTTTATHTNSVTTLKLTTTDFLQPNDVIKNTTTDENMLVLTIVSANSITVTRGWGEVSGTAMSASGQIITKLGPAYADGADKNTPLQRLLDSGYNVIQDFRKECGLDWNTDATKMYSGSERERLRKDAMRELKRQMERQFLFGQLKVGGTANAPQRQTRGLKYFISTNVHNIAGALTEPTFLGHLESDFRYGSSKKVLLASSRFITAMASWGLNRMRANEAMTKTLGIKVESYLSPFGEIDVAWHKMLEGAYAGTAFLVDPDNVRYTYQKGHDFQMRTNIQSPGEHKFIDEFYAYAGLDMMVEKAHAYYYGVTG